MKIGIVLAHEHRLLSVAAINDLFETVNGFYIEEGKDPFFEIDFLHHGEKNSFIYSDYNLREANSETFYDVILIPAFKNNKIIEGLQKNQPWIPWLVQQYNQGAALASFCTGAFLLASTGLLNNKPATTHINAKMAFLNAFPNVLLESDAVVTEEDNLYTSGGATNTFHLLMRLVENYCSRKIAVRTAKVFSIDMDRKTQTYFGTFLPVENHGDEIVKKTQEKIKSNYKEANTIEEIIVDIPSSRRNLVRRFKQVTGITPIEYLQKTRIEAAKQLLEHSKQNVMEVMLESGYNDLKSFRTLFKKNVGMTPTAYREKFSA
ncbi:transcriptional regulator GlxA family with amidase domain [Flavobacterium arsenatis]|uniref:Transcriptional regulator GlxA family with amidase domain n=1 Tax=Flavobacterium arsenatis TaxID=1484332 RepID=A0ABU1TRW5_9FLAO|nr:helix-turn-helix domain-containing protein [Flavobacterium arsenatis]MDR6968617.1 transcriptional regulator GlxA family with amidase domain [Flavobacterium arsenatis]